MVLSGTAEYAIRTVLELARQPAGEVIAVEVLADRLAIPRNYLSKVLSRLAQEGVVHSIRGKGGGFRLALPPEQIMLQQVVAPFDGGTAERRCLLGRPHCSDRNPCEAHVSWKAVSERIATFFRETTVAELAARPRPRVDPAVA